MHYLLLIHLDEAASLARSDDEIRSAMEAHVPYIERLRKNGRYLASEALEASRSARTLRRTNGKPITMAGPFAESREQLGGFYVVDAEHLDEAIAIAAECPALTTRHDDVLAIEIRPLAASSFVQTSAEPWGGLGRPATNALDRWFLSVRGAETWNEADDDLRHRTFTRWQPALARLRVGGHLAGVMLLTAEGSATTLRSRQERIDLRDGPFAPGSSPLIGCWMLRARDVAEAVALAVDGPAEDGSIVEVRRVRSAPLE